MTLPPRSKAVFGANLHRENDFSRCDLVYHLSSLLPVRSFSVLPRHRLPPIAGMEKANFPLQEKTLCVGSPHAVDSVKDDPFCRTPTLF